jgi:hypothetical protein
MQPRSPRDRPHSTQGNTSPREQQRKVSPGTWPPPQRKYETPNPQPNESDQVHDHDNQEVMANPRTEHSRPMLPRECDHSRPSLVVTREERQQAHERTTSRIKLSRALVLAETTPSPQETPRGDNGNQTPPRTPPSGPGTRFKLTTMEQQSVVQDTEEDSSESKEGTVPVIENSTSGFATTPNHNYIEPSKTPQLSEEELLALFEDEERQANMVKPKEDKRNKTKSVGGGCTSCSSSAS